MPPVQQLSDHAAHGVTHRDEPGDAEGAGQRGDIVGAVLEPEPRASADPVTVAAQVGRDDPECRRASGAKTFPQFSSAVKVTPWMSMSVSAPGGPAHSHTRVTPRPGSSTRRVSGAAASPSTCRTTLTLLSNLSARASDRRPAGHHTVFSC